MDNRSACEVFVEHEELAACCIAAYALDEEATLAARQRASDVLAYLSGWTVFGTCNAVVRPQGVICLDGQDAIPLTWPVREINSVWVDGVELAADQYALVDKRYLIRRDCLSWPCHQWLDRPRTEYYTFEIDYDFGSDIPYQAKMAANELACQYQRGCAGDNDCLLPGTVTSLSTQGMSYSLKADAEEALGVAGDNLLPLVQEFLATVNPGMIYVPTDVYSPDMPKLRKVQYFT